MKKFKPSSNLTSAPPYEPFTWLWWVFIVVCFGIGGFFVWFFNLPYAQAHEYARWLSPRHRLASFTIDVFEFLQPIGLVLAAALLTTGVCLLTFPTKTRQIVARGMRWLVKQPRRLSHDSLRLWQDFRPHRSGWFELATVLLLMCAAILVRILFLSYPMRYDESYTVVVFAMRPWLNLISDYHLPNNHIFHSILVKLAINLLGTAPWAVRFPAFINGILCVPAGYLVARQLYGRISALLSAGLIAALPILISYSTNARGYSQYALYSLVLFGLAVYLSKHANLAGWGLFVIVAASGFYTVPFMLFPFGAICLWLVASAAAGETRQAYGSLIGLLKYLISAGILTVLFTFLLYSPVILIGTGLDSLVGNPFIWRPGWAEFWLRLGEEFKNSWMSWNYDLPQVIQILLSAGVILSLIFHHWISRVKISTQITFFTWTLGVLVTLRLNPMDRTWFFLLPFWLIWACGGLIAPLSILRHPWKRLGLVLTIGSLVITANWSIQRLHTYFPGWQPEPGKVERAAEYLSANLVPGDAIAVVFPDDAPFWYYLGRFGVADEFMHQIELETHKRVFAVVDTLYDETPAHVLQTHDLSPEEYQADQAELVYQVADLKIFLCLHQ